MSRYVRSESSLDAGLRELAILATALELGQPYEMSHHTAAAALLELESDSSSQR